MKPRLKTSKKWTAFPKEYLAQIQEVFMKGFETQLKGAKLVVDGRIYTSEILLRVGFLENGRLKQANFEVSMDYDTVKKDALDRIMNAIDAAASMMQEYFEAEGDVDFPVIWQEFEFENRKLFFQFTTENSDLEAKANALLGKSNPELVVEEAEEDEDLAPAGPTIFTGKGSGKAKPTKH